MEIRNTNEVSQHRVKLLVYGQAGAGKTRLAATMPQPCLVLSAEAGLLSLRGSGLDFVEVKTIDELTEAYRFLLTKPALKYQSVALDSVSEIAEVLLAHEKKAAKDPRQAYGALSDRMSALIRVFRDLPDHHIYFSAKMEKSADELGKVAYSPSLPGNKVGQSLPYFFDEVLALRVEKNEEGKPYRVLQCDSDGGWLAKDRSGKLEMFEQPNLAEVINKILETKEQ